MPNIPADFQPRLEAAAVLIADDHTLIRSGLKLLLLGLLGNVQFIEAADGDEMIRAARSFPSLRLGLVGLNMPSMLARARLLELSRCRPSLPLVVVSGLMSPEIVGWAMSIPTVFGFVPKSADANTLRIAIEAALRGCRLSPSSLVVRQKEVLTPRQDEVHRLLGQGMSNKLIARTLGITEGTVKNHITEIFRILNTTNRTQAAQLVPPSRPQDLTGSGDWGG
jgi:DNA-binding NarL/FixJ family response regulator